MSAREALDRMLRLCRDFVSPAMGDVDLLRAFQGFRVRCFADETNLASANGQTAFATLVGLVARMGVQVDLDIPEVPLVAPQPPITGRWLRAGLQDLGTDLIPRSSIECGSAAASDIVLALGDTPTPRSAGLGWRLSGDDWSGSIDPIYAKGRVWEGDFPIGAMTAAVLATTEVFKTILLRLPLADPYHARYLAIVEAVRWAFPAWPVSPAVDCGPVDLISAGAIGQSLLFALLRLPGVTGAARIFEDDIVELSNLNRSVLVRRSDVSQRKAAVMARYQNPGFRITPVLERFRPDTLQRLLLTPSVLVGVDDIPSRWVVQRAKPRWLGIGGTSHFDASSSSHEPGEPCAGCLHPVDDPGSDGPLPTVSFVSFWAGLALATRFVLHRLGVSSSHGQQHLWMATLRMDSPNAGRWLPVARRNDCPVRCAA